MNVRVIIGIILAVTAGLFIIQNVTVMELKFLFWTLSMSRSLFMFLILSVGMILGYLLHGSFNKRKSNIHGQERSSRPGGVKKTAE